MKFKSMYRDEEFALSNCPFCDAVPKIKHIGNVHTKKSIEIRCSACSILMKNSAIHRSMDWLEDISVSQWNNRVNTKQLEEAKAQGFRDAIKEMGKVKGL